MMETLQQLGTTFNLITDTHNHEFALLFFNGGGGDEQFVHGRLDSSKVEYFYSF